MNTDWKGKLSKALYSFAIIFSVLNFIAIIFSVLNFIAVIYVHWGSIHSGKGLNPFIGFWFVFYFGISTFAWAVGSILRWNKSMTIYYWLSIVLAIFTILIFSVSFT